MPKAYDIYYLTKKFKIHKTQLKKGKYEIKRTGICYNKYEAKEKTWYIELEYLGNKYYKGVYYEITEKAFEENFINELKYKLKLLIK